MKQMTELAANKVYINPLVGMNGKEGQLFELQTRGYNIQRPVIIPIFWELQLSWWELNYFYKYSTGFSSEIRLTKEVLDVISSVS